MLKMDQIFYNLLNDVLHLMLENKLRRDIDDTLLEKLLTFIKKSNNIQSIRNKSFNKECKNHNKHFDFIEELVRKTKALDLIKNVICAVSERNDKYYIGIQTFSLRLLGLVLENPKQLFSLDSLLLSQVFIDKDKKVVSDHILSVQDALIFCLSCLTKNVRSTMWFIENNMERFIFSSFNSSSYYVRKSAVNFFVDFITQWTQLDKQELEVKLEIQHITDYVRKNVSYILSNIHYYQSPKEMTFSECCIYIIKELLTLEHSESVIGDSLSLSKNVAECFMDLPDNDEFNTKLTDFFLSIFERSSLPDKIITDAIKCLILREDIKLSFSLASSYGKVSWQKDYNSSDIVFFFIPVYVLTGEPLNDYESFFHMDANFIYEMIVNKMETKIDSKLLFLASLSAMQKLVPLLHPDHRKELAVHLLKVVKIPEIPFHRWHFSILEDRSIHHSFLDLFSSFIDDEVHMSFVSDERDLVFELILEFLKKPSPNSNFLSQLLLLMKNLLLLHEKMKFNLNDANKESLVLVLCRMLLDNRENVVDSGIQLAGQIFSGDVACSWQEKVSKQSVHSIIWDIAIHGCHDGSIRSTALRVIMKGCLETWGLDQIKSLKGTNEIDIAKILFDLTHDPDFFLQREALSCLFQWLKAKWNDLPPSAVDYLFSALLSAVKSLDLELKLISLDAWSWLVQNKLTYDASNFKKYIELLADCGFGLCLILGLEDYDEAVRYKASEILFEVKSKLISDGLSKDFLLVNTNREQTNNYHVLVKQLEPLTVEKKNEGIDIVMEISTSEQIASICRPPNVSDVYNFKQDYFSSNMEDRKCSVNKFWNYLWSDNLLSIMEPEKVQDMNSEIESLLNDILAAKISDSSSIEETPDCY